MTDLVHNSAKGSWAYLALLSGTNDALIAVPLKATGLGTAAQLRDCTTLAAVLAVATEQTTMGRKTLTGVTVTVDQPNDRKSVDADDVVWTAATGDATGALCICYDPDTTSGTDADIYPLFTLDMAATPAGGNITYAFNAGGIARAT